jgi:hypothetical protein
VERRPNSNIELFFFFCLLGGELLLWTENVPCWRPSTDHPWISAGVKFFLYKCLQEIFNTAQKGLKSCIPIFSGSNAPSKNGSGPKNPSGVPPDPHLKTEKHRKSSTIATNQRKTSKISPLQKSSSKCNPPPPRSGTPPPSREVLGPKRPRMAPHRALLHVAPAISAS